MAILATHVGGIPEVITDGVHGRLITPKDSEALYDGLIELLGNEDKRREFGEAARKRAENEDSVKDSIEKLIRIYNQVMGE